MVCTNMTTKIHSGTMHPAEAPEYFYTKQEVDALVADAVAQAHEADRILMAKHNRTATIISMILGLICLALFVDGLLRILGIIPPFMDLDVNVIDDVIEKVEEDIMPIIEPYVKKGLQYIPRR